MKIVSLFTGIGAFEKSLTNLGIEHEVVAFSEIDKYATTAYCTIHGIDEEKNMGDITLIDPATVPDCDMITHGSPCTDFSFSGKGEGGDEGSGTRSSLMWYTVNIVEHKRPKYVIWENVKGVLSKRHKHNFDKYLDKMEMLGYNNYYEVLNSKDFGTPQNRERIYVISIRKDLDDHSFTFPTPIPLEKRLKDVLEEKVDEKYYIQNEKTDKLLESLMGREIIPGGINVSRKGEVFEENTEVASCLLARDYKGLGNQAMTAVAEPIIVASRGRNPENPSDRTTGSPTEQRLEPNSQGISNTLTSVTKDNLVLEPRILRNERTDYGKEVRKAYESGELNEKIGNMRELAPRPDSVTNTISTITKDNLLLEPVRLGGLYDKPKSRHQAGSVWDKESVAPTIDTMQGGNREPLIIEEGYVERKYREFVDENGYILEAFNPYNCKEIEDIAPTMTSQCGSTTSSATILFKDIPFRIRKLTPLECWRLMEFSDEDYFKAKKALELTHYNGRDRSNSQMYKMSGNSIVVKTLESIFKNLFKEELGVE